VLQPAAPHQCALQPAAPRPLAPASPSPRAGLAPPLRARVSRSARRHVGLTLFVEEDRKGVKEKGTSVFSSIIFNLLYFLKPKIQMKLTVSIIRGKQQLHFKILQVKSQIKKRRGKITIDILAKNTIARCHYSGSHFLTVWFRPQDDMHCKKGSYLMLVVLI
jgi:hypothetical protein